MAKKDKYADIILPLSVSGTFTYKIPDGFREQVKIGMRVIIPFGQKKFYSGIIIRLHHSPPAGFQIREIKSVIDSLPVVNSFQLNFWNWIGEYYMCSPGEVMNASIPSGLNMESETIISLKKIPDKDFQTEQEELKLISVLDLEGLALNGLLEKFHVLKCKEKGKVKIVAKSVDGSEVETPCFDEFRLGVELRILENYRRWGRKIYTSCLLYTSPSPRDLSTSRMPSSA